MAGNTSSISTAPQWALKVDQVDPNNVYIGYSIIGTSSAAAKWQIRKFITSGNVLSVLWANGSTAANQIWDSRTSLVYS